MWQKESRMISRIWGLSSGDECNGINTDGSNWQRTRLERVECRVEDQDLEGMVGEEFCFG